MSVHGNLEEVIRRELGACASALNGGDVAKAKRELDSAVSKLKDIERKVSRLERAAKA